MRRWAALALVVVLLGLSSSASAAAEPRGGFVCPDGSVVTTAEQCASSGNKSEVTNPSGPAGFPGTGGGGSGSGGGLLGIVHRLTGGLL